MFWILSWRWRLAVTLPMPCGPSGGTGVPGGSGGRFFSCRSWLENVRHHQRQLLAHLRGIKIELQLVNVLLELTQLHITLIRYLRPPSAGAGLEPLRGLTQELVTQGMEARSFDAQFPAGLVNGHRPAQRGQKHFQAALRQLGTIGRLSQLDSQYRPSSFGHDQSSVTHNPRRVKHRRAASVPSPRIGVHDGSLRCDHRRLGTTMTGSAAWRTTRLVLTLQELDGPITLLQHLFAAFEQPYVALLGGREPVMWTQCPAR